jgi:hypothetical protein
LAAIETDAWRLRDDRLRGAQAPASRTVKPVERGAIIVAP